MTIDGLPVAHHAGSLEIIEGINGRSSARFAVDSIGGLYQPEVGHEVSIVIDDDVAFAGVITEREVTWIALGDSTRTTCTAADFTHYADRRRITAETNGGFTGRDAIDYLVANYLAGYGITRDPAMPPGGILGALSYSLATVTEVLNDIVRLAAPAGWIWRIDENKVLTALRPSISAWPCPFGLVAPFNDGYLVGDVTLTDTRENFANRVFVSYNDGTDTPAQVSAENADSIADVGLYETGIHHHLKISNTTAQNIANGYCDQLSTRPEQIRFTTRRPGARAGMTMPVDLTDRPLRDPESKRFIFVRSGDYLITEMRIWDRPGDHLFYEITATYGAVARDPVWKGTYAKWGLDTPVRPVPSSGGTVSTLIYAQDFEGGGDLDTLAVDYLGTSTNLQAENTVNEGLNGTSYGLFTTEDFPEVGFNLGAPGFGDHRSGWAEFYTDFSNLQAFGWTLVAATAGNFGIFQAIFDLNVGTDSGTPTFWLYSNGNTLQGTVGSLFTASTEYKVRIHWTQSTYSGGSPNADGAFSLFLDDVEVWTLTNITIARASSTSSVQITRMYFNPCGRLDEIRVGHSTYTPGP